MPRPSIEASPGPSAVNAARLCDHPGCHAGGDYRAPRSRDRLHVFYWFCLDHVRAYNAQWNYYAGMSAAEIEAEIRNDTVWQRPTWPLGGRCGVGAGFRFRDGGLFGFEDGEADEKGERPRKRPLSEHEQALAVFDLAPPVTLGGLKARYKELVKLHHPDAHGGDRAAEERLKIINQAYSTLKTSYSPSG
jgi:DnaJ domain